MSEELCTVRAVAAELDLHPKTVLRYIHEGKLPATRVGKSYRIRRSDLAQLVGMPLASERSAGRTTVTAVADVEDVTADEAMAAANVFSAAGMGRDKGSAPLHVSTTHYPAQRRLKVIVIGSPADAARMLQLIDVQIGNLR
ncbi:hypothetical protein GCM10009127_04620 [Alteraurantiacibacter aestuarii]|uniref:Helix-turn-helix domain-containing protein n=1 Tax=Alteraurantiacibacter aestuarii TaxID=650004 RepID=A0A844ZKI6_9SPHN|nr:helix-turn-helix domain-containing protein [Alteraurantiacibacter aestuarii]MXO88288.1 helix-turn-helix domain-containing protein [Alteraurantiacibacter aestuarii]